MTRGWRELVLGCLALVIYGATGATCFAKPQEQRVEAAGVDKKEDPSHESESQDSDSEPPSKSADDENSLGIRWLANFAKDQKAIWASPASLRLVDVDWLLPLGAATGGMLATDTEYSKHLSNSPSRLKYSTDLSNYGLGAFAGVGGGLYLWGEITHDDHKSETGLLAGEAAVDSFAVAYALKYAFGRQRPLQNNYRGNFWSGGDSFPSEHSAAAWSIAGIIAHEYPGPLTTVLAYGAAAAISASRIDAKQHFPSDVLIGSVIGWYVGQHVYRAHHNPELGGDEWQTYAEAHDDEPDPDLSTKTGGSPYVELDSWIYPALERLAALGYIDSEFLGMRPWTRIECSHLVEEAGDRIRAEESDPPEVNRLYETLAKEFETDLDVLTGGAGRSIHLESAYTRLTEIEGQPLHDSYHFGQTIINDFGRPYEEGFNNVTGLSGWGTAGRFTIYVRGEYQNAPSAPAYSEQITNTIASIDQNPIQPPTPVAKVSQFRLLDAYVSADLENWSLSFGKQSLWWGPDYGSAMLFSNNAEPIYMFRASRIAPFTLPWIFHYLGPMKLDFFFGKLSDNQFPPRPLIHGEKVSFKPTPNLEMSFSRTSEFGGVGRPLTPGALWNSYFSFHSSVLYQESQSPGKRTGGFDFTYRVPLLRDWLTVYADSLSDDEPTPVYDGNKTGWNPGIYLTHVPRLPKLDLRVEGVNTDTSKSQGGHYIYFDSFYHDLYTNKNNVIGSWIGREGKGIQAWSTYSFSSRSTFQLGYRHAKVDSDFIPGGETVNDASAKLDWWVRSDLNVSTFFQYEKWLAPILAPGPQTNWTTSVQVGFWPRLWSK
jgi:Capsule assembly protein Wzi/PAP2 superfamily